MILNLGTDKNNRLVPPPKELAGKEKEEKEDDSSRKHLGDLFQLEIHNTDRNTLQKIFFSALTFSKHLPYQIAAIDQRGTLFLFDISLNKYGHFLSDLMILFDISPDGQSSNTVLKYVDMKL
jgi:hypothetical protein